MKFFKIFTVPIITSIIFYIIIKLDILPDIFEKITIDTKIYRLLFPSKRVIYMFDTLGIRLFLASAFFIVLLIVLRFFTKDIEYRKGMNFTLLFFIGLIVYSMYITITY